MTDALSMRRLLAVRLSSPVFSGFTEPNLTISPYRPSDSVNTVASGLKELNKRVGERKGEKVVIKIMWDRGAVQQLWQCVPSQPLAALHLF